VDFQSNLTGQQNKSLADAYQSALTGAYNQGNLQNQVAQTQGTLAGKEQELGLKGSSALTQAGAAQQQYNQSVLDFPLTNALNSMKVLNGLTIPQGSVKTGPGSRDNYGNSTLQNLAGISALIGSAGAGKVGDFLFGSGGKPGFLSGFNSGTQTVNPSEFIGAGADGRGLYFNPAKGIYYDSSGKPQGINWDADYSGGASGSVGGVQTGVGGSGYSTDGEYT
jgi:hypothetical protein